MEEVAYETGESLGYKKDFKMNISCFVIALIVLFFYFLDFFQFFKNVESFCVQKNTRPTEYFECNHGFDKTTNVFKFCFPTITNQHEFSFLLSAKKRDDFKENETVAKTKLTYTQNNTDVIFSQNRNITFKWKSTSFESNTINFTTPFKQHVKDGCFNINITVRKKALSGFYATESVTYILRKNMDDKIKKLIENSNLFLLILVTQFLFCRKNFTSIIGLFIGVGCYLYSSSVIYKVPRKFNIFNEANFDSIIKSGIPSICLYSILDEFNYTAPLILFLVIYIANFAFSLMVNPTEVHPLISLNLNRRTNVINFAFSVVVFEAVVSIILLGFLIYKDIRSRIYINTLTLIITCVMFTLEMASLNNILHIFESLKEYQIQLLSVIEKIVSGMAISIIYTTPCISIQQNGYQ